ncbi:hypothetical protein MKW92_019178, partial [Papaver armeniacum]
QEESTLQQEESTVEPRKTREERVAIFKREIKQNRVKVARLREDGTVYYSYIATRSLWLRMCREEWGATHEETATLVKGLRHMFVIEICGTDLGCGVILRDSARCPIVALSRVFTDYVSQFYFELQGVSLGLKLAMKYKIRHFDMICTSHGIAQYVMLTLRNKCCCSRPRDDDPKNPEKKKFYCVECSRSLLDELDEGRNVDKISRLMDEIFYDALECRDYITFGLRASELSRMKAVCHLANSGIDQELRLPDIEEDENLVDILYKDVYRHVSKEEMVVQQQQLMLQKQQRKMVDIYNKEVFSYVYKTAMQ